MYNVLFSLLLVLTMAEQIGVQSGARVGIHNHLNISQGGILNEYSRDGAFMETYRTGGLAVHVDNDDEVISGIDALVLVKQFTVDTAQRGEFRFTWQSRTSLLGEPVNSVLYVNGVAVGADNIHANDVYQNHLHNYDLDLAVGDRIQIYALATMGHQVRIQNFRIYYDWAVKYFGDSGKVLVAPLLLTNNDLIDVTADF